MAENRVRALIDELLRTGKTLVLDPRYIGDAEAEAFELEFPGLDIFTYTEAVRSGEIVWEEVCRTTETRGPFIAFIWLSLRTQYPDIEFEEVRHGLGFGFIGSLIDIMDMNDTTRATVATAARNRDTNGTQAKPSAARGARRTLPAKSP